MAFAFPSLGFHQMWMPPDMLVSLDMLWIDDQGKIVEIMEQAQPCKTPPCPALGGSFPSRYVLELPAGTVEIHGIRPGQFVSF
jgi:uncharacterized membrane protein (UPF0127 family)